MIKKQLRLFGLIMAAMAMMFTMNSCGGDNSSDSTSGGSTTPSLLGAWYANIGSYMLVFDFGSSNVAYTIYEINGSVYYMTTVSAPYLKAGETVTFTIGGQPYSAIVGENTLVMTEPDLGRLTLNRVAGTVQTQVSTMEAYFDNLQKQIVNEWYSYSDYYNSYEVLKFEASGKGTWTDYRTYTTYSGPSLTWTRGGSMGISYDNGTTERVKFNLKGGVLNIIYSYEGTDYTLTYQPMTDEVRQRIENLRNTPTLQSGTYVENNPDMKEYFMLEIDDNDMEEFVVTYGKKKKLIEGSFSISGNQITIAGVDVNGDGVVNDNDKMNITVNGNEFTVGGMTFVRTEVTWDKLIGHWQSMRTIGAAYDNDGETILNKWDWTLTGSSTGNEAIDNENIRMLLNSDGTFQSSVMMNGVWTQVQAGTFSYADSRITTTFADGGQTLTESWKVISVNDSEAIIEFWDGGYIYRSYYMKKL